jgi:flagellar hook-associated protein 2
VIRSCIQCHYRSTVSTHNISVSQLAQAQTISTPGQASTTGTIGAGTSTLTFQFGTISGGTSTGGVYSGASFTQDAAQASGTVTIDSTNNSLQGIRMPLIMPKLVCRHRLSAMAVQPHTIWY